MPLDWVDPTKCTLNYLLCPLSPPPKTESGGEQAKPFPCGGVSHQHLAWTGIVRNHWKWSNLGGIRSLPQLLLPNVSSARSRNWFQVTHSRAARGRVTSGRACGSCAGDTASQRSSAGKGAGQRTARGDSPLTVTGRARSEETQPDPYCSE